VWSGETGGPLAEALKLQYAPITRVENACCSASDALRNATYAVAAGVVRIALAIGVEKLKDSGFSGLGAAAQPSSNITPNSTAPGMFAMMATKYFSQYGLSPEDGKKMIGLVSVKSHKNGTLNPKAHFQREVSLETVLKAPIIAWPLGLFDCCGVSDGSAAAIVVRAENAKAFRSDPVRIKALQMSVGAEGLVRSDYDYAHVESTYWAGLRAYKEAGVKNPREEIGMSEVHDCFSITEAVTMEDLQFSPRGKVNEDILAGFFNIDGGLPVQPDGGLKCFGHPIGASGLRMIYEMYKQLQGKAGPRQLKDPKWGLPHNLGGVPPACTCFVGIFGL
ncbi:MAG: acetyl-CoA acetyltransferase, partial [Chloroflexota bacterium]|nr:acetyl-CoA acetyltransferase [Chloroflexota bacterium]